MCHLVVLAFPSAINHSHGTLASFDLIKIVKKEKVSLFFIGKGWSFLSLFHLGPLVVWPTHIKSHSEYFCELSCMRLCLPTHSPVSLLNREASALHRRYPIPPEVHQLLILKTRLSSCWWSFGHLSFASLPLKPHAVLWYNLQWSAGSHLTVGNRSVCSVTSSTLPYIGSTLPGSPTRPPQQVRGIRQFEWSNKTENGTMKNWVDFAYFMKALG